MKSFHTFLSFVKKYERQIPAFALILGFFWDIFTLGRPDGLYENPVLLSWLLVSAAAIVVLPILKRKESTKQVLFLGALQFAFGNLAGSLIVLYGQSGTFQGSAIFFLLLGGFLLGNEFLREKYARTHFHIAAWYVLLFSYLSLVVPIIMRDYGTTVFLIGGLTSLLIVGVLLLVLYSVSSKNSVADVRKVSFFVGIIYVLYTAFYFFNVIPPVPLSLKSVGIYHEVSRLPSGNYKVVYEKPALYEFLRDTGSVFHYTPQSVAYCFTSVFIPPRFSELVFHRWEKYDAVEKEWVTESRISFPILGGRETGYRGYTEKTALSSGEWRCSVETERGALIGRVSFEIKAGVPISLKEEVL